MKRNCGNCLTGRPAGRQQTWCHLYGILISCKHEGCRYHIHEDDRREDHDHTQVDMPDLRSDTP